MYFIIFISSFAYLLGWEVGIDKMGREKIAVCHYLVGICRFSCFKLWYYYLCILFKPSMPSLQNGLLTMNTHTQREREFKRLYVRRFYFVVGEKLNQLYAFIPTKIKLNSLFHLNILSQLLVLVLVDYVYVQCALGKVSHGHLIMLKLYFSVREIIWHAKWLWNYT